MNNNIQEKIAIRNSGSDSFEYDVTRVDGRMAYKIKNLTAHSIPTEPGRKDYNINLDIPLEFELNKQNNNFCIIVIKDRIYIAIANGYFDYCLYGYLDRNFSNKIMSCFPKREDLYMVFAIEEDNYSIEINNDTFKFKLTQTNEILSAHIYYAIPKSNIELLMKKSFYDFLDNILPEEYTPISSLINTISSEVKTKNEWYEYVSDTIMLNHVRVYDDGNNYFRKYVEKIKEIRDIKIEEKTVREQMLEYSYDRLAKAEYDYLICKHTQNVKLCYGLINGYGIAMEALLKVLLIREISDVEIEQANKQYGKNVNKQDLYNGLEKINNYKEKNSRNDKDESKEENEKINYNYKNPILFLKMIKDIEDNGFIFSNSQASLGTYGYYNSDKGWKNGQSQYKKFNKNDYGCENEIKFIFSGRLNKDLEDCLNQIIDLRNNDSHPNVMYLNDVELIRETIFGKLINSEESIVSQGKNAYSNEDVSKGFLWNILKDNWDGLVALL